MKLSIFFGVTDEHGLVRQFYLSINPEFQPIKMSSGQAWTPNEYSYPALTAA